MWGNGRWSFRKFWRTVSPTGGLSPIKSFRRVQLFATPWTVAHQAPPSMRFSRQEYWSGLPFPSTGDLPDPGIEPRSPTLQADALTSKPPGKPKSNYIRFGYMGFWQFTVQICTYKGSSTSWWPIGCTGNQVVSCDFKQLHPWGLLFVCFVLFFCSAIWSMGS